MIKGLYQIGKINKEEIVKSFVEEIEGDKKYIVEINFDTQSKSVSPTTKEYSKGDEYNYNFIRMNLTGRQNQPFVVFSDEKRIFGENGKHYAIWTSLKDEIKDKDEKLEKKIEQVEKIFYENDELKKNYKEDIESYLSKNNIIKKKIAFWVVKIDNEYIQNNKSYLNLIEKKILEEKAETGKIICHLCSKETEKFYTDFSRLKMKIYINDKLGFSQNISNNWEGNFALCEDCYKILIRGQSFILNKFSSRVGNINYLIIPEFIKEPTNLNKNKLEKWSEYIKFYKNPFEFFNNEFEEKIENYKEFEDHDNFVLLNYLFYEENNQQFKVFGLIKDIPNGRIEKLRKKFKEIRNEFRVFFEDDYIIKNLSDIYYLIPLRISDNKIVDIQKIMNLFSNIFNENPVDIDNLIYDFTVGFKAIFYENNAYHLSKFFNNNQIKYILKTHQLLKFLKGGESVMNLDDLEKDYKDYIEKCSFDEKKTALFLLGIVIGKIGSIQYTQYNYKPILEKVNFNGMNEEKLKILYSEVCEKMKQLDIYGNYEVIYALSKQLFDKNFKNWDLKSYENTYYILSGYAFETYRIIKGGSRNDKE